VLAKHNDAEIAVGKALAYFLQQAASHYELILVVPYVKVARQRLCQWPDEIVFVLGGVANEELLLHVRYIPVRKHQFVRAELKIAAILLEI
jgi:hypothetical protein